MTSGPCSKLCAIMSGVDGSPEVAPAPPLLRSPCMQVTRRQYRRQMQEATARALAETAHLLAQERAAEGVRRVFLRAGLAVCARAHARTTRRCCRPARAAPTCRRSLLQLHSSLARVRAIAAAARRRARGIRAVIVAVIAVVVALDTNTDVFGRRLGWAAASVVGDAHYAAARGNVWRLEHELTLRGTDPNGVDERGDTLLHAALRGGQGRGVCECVVRRAADARARRVIRVT